MSTESVIVHDHVHVHAHMHALRLSDSVSDRAVTQRPLGGELSCPMTHMCMHMCMSLSYSADHLFNTWSQLNWGHVTEGPYCDAQLAGKEAEAAALLRSEQRDHGAALRLQSAPASVSASSVDCDVARAAAPARALCLCGQRGACRCLT